MHDARNFSPHPWHALVNGKRNGFTMIELSIVLVIIGLIIGGVLVGRDMIEAAQIRAQISQIEKFQTAVHTFQAKYNCLPGDCAQAANFGFPASGAYAGEGDGDGVIEGVNFDAAGHNSGLWQTAGETVTFWVDLSEANLIEGKFNTASSTAVPGADITGSAVGNYLPPAKLGQGNYVCAWSGGVNVSTASDRVNYFCIANVTSITYALKEVVGAPGMTVAQAYAIDTKMDDGYPQSGSVMAVLVNGSSAFGAWWVAGAVAPYFLGATPGSATSGTSVTCYDNNNVGGAVEQYSMAQKNGAGVNCALSFRFQ